MKIIKCLIFVTAITLSIVEMGFDYRNIFNQNNVQADKYIVTTWAGNAHTREPRDGTRQEASFTSDMTSLTIDASGNIFVNDAWCLRKISPEGTVTTLFGQNVYDAAGKPKVVPAMKSAVNDGSIVEINALAFHPKTNALYISADERAIYRMTGTQPPVRIAGRMPEAEYNESPNGDGDLKSVKFRKPQAMCVDRNGNLFLVDKYRMVRKISMDGKVTTIVGKVQDTMGQRAEEPVYQGGPISRAILANIGGIAVDSQGNIFVSQQDIHCILKISATGEVSVFAGTPKEGEGQTLDGSGSKARFYNPGALAIDNQDNLFVADKRKVRKITPQGLVTTIAGGSVADGEWQALYKDGDGAIAQFTALEGIACDDAGNIYVVDEARVRKISRK